MPYPESSGEEAVGPDGGKASGDEPLGPFTVPEAFAEEFLEGLTECLKKGVELQEEVDAAEDESLALRKHNYH